MNGCFNENMTGTDAFAPGGEQVQICEAVKYDGGNHAIFGEAGTGKTCLIRLLVNELRTMGRNVMCVAPTGITTQNLGILAGVPRQASRASGKEWAGGCGDETDMDAL